MASGFGEPVFFLAQKESGEMVTEKHAGVGFIVSEETQQFKVGTTKLLKGMRSLRSPHRIAYYELMVLLYPVRVLEQSGILSCRVDPGHTVQQAAPSTQPRLTRFPMKFVWIRAPLIPFSVCE